MQYKHANITTDYFSYLFNAHLMLIDQRHINTTGISFCKNPPVNNVLKGKKFRPTYWPITKMSITIKQ